MKNSIAKSHSFYEILNSDENSDLDMFYLKDKCLKTGLVYIQNLERWLNLFKPEQLFIVDTDLFKKHPIEYLNNIQALFELQSIIDYNQKVVFSSNETKSNLCFGGNSKCSSFQKYDPIDENSFNILQQIFSQSNKNLNDLLRQFDLQIPTWLEIGQ